MLEGYFSFSWDVSCRSNTESPSSLEINNVNPRAAGWLEEDAAQQGENTAPGSGQLGTQGLHDWVRAPLQHLSQADVAQITSKLPVKGGRCRVLERMTSRERNNVS